MEKGKRLSPETSRLKNNSKIAQYDRKIHPSVLEETVVQAHGFLVQLQADAYQGGYSRGLERSVTGMGV